MSERPLLVIDTSTRTPTVGLATADGNLLGARQWQSRHRHDERLLEQLDAVLAELGFGRGDLAGVVAGTGPGSFTGLRIGLATAKVIAYGLSVPLVGVSSTLALALAAGAGQAAGTVIAVCLPAGAVDRYVHRVRRTGASVEEMAPPKLVAGEADFRAAVGEALIVAADIEDPGIPAELGANAVDGLAAALARLGAADLAAGRTADPAELVPAYVALPRGIAHAAASMQWSPDLR
jgi:tRNA threonylcarbamoyladenosine biosynthesis protein TsaB